MVKQAKNKSAVVLRDLAPTFDQWPESWMGMKEDLEYGKKLLPFFEDFLAKKHALKS